MLGCLFESWSIDDHAALTYSFKGEESSGEILIIGEEGLDFPTVVFDAVSEGGFSRGASSTCSPH